MMTLTTEHQAWLNAHIESGEFASIDEAVNWLISERMAQESDDLAWLKPQVDAARAVAARGEVLSLDDHKTRNAARLAALR